MNNSFIKLYRGLLDWEWYSDVNTKTVFIHCLIKANWEDKRWRGVLIKRGQFFTSLDSLCNELNLSKKAIRISLDKLKKTKEIVVNGARIGTMITICKYDDYQSLEIQEGTKGARKGHTRGTKGATTKKYKEEEEIKKDRFVAPTLLEVKDYFKEKGYSENAAVKAFEYYDVSKWIDSKGNKVKNWKQKMISVWMKDENKIQTKQMVF